MRRSIGESLFISALFIIVLTVPGFVADLEPLTRQCIYLILDLLILLLLFNSLNRAGAFSKESQEPNWKNLLKMSPVLVSLLFLAIVTIYYGFSLITLFPVNDELLFFLEALETILIVLIEELLFRLYYFRQIRTENPLLRILISAAIFALFDVLMFIQTRDLQIVALHMLFSFLLGLVLGAIMEYGHCVYFCIGFHLLLRALYGNYLDAFLVITPFGFVLMNPIIIVLIALAYLGVAYFVFFRKKDEYDVQ